MDLNKVITVVKAKGFQHAILWAICLDDTRVQIKFLESLIEYIKPLRTYVYDLKLGTKM
jgi:hypothetical protein